MEGKRDRHSCTSTSWSSSPSTTGIRLSSGYESELLVELHQPITDATSLPGEARLFCEIADGIKAWVGKRAKQISHGYKLHGLLVLKGFTCSGFFFHSQIFFAIFQNLVNCHTAYIGRITSMMEPYKWQLFTWFNSFSMLLSEWHANISTKTLCCSCFMELSSSLCSAALEFG